jgi:hypothetical protein
MAEREIRLESAAFLDSPQARSLAGLGRDEVRTIADRFLACAYDEIGKAPRFLDGDDARTILAELLPGHFGKRDPLAAHVPAVLDAYLDFLEGHAVVAHMLEIRLALDAACEAFARAVREGTVAPRAPATKPRPFVHRAEKTGRNDPCPCGSGKKFKQCCMKRG